jgi:hypothetical protein
VPGCIVAALLGAGASGLVACGNQNGLLSASSGSSLTDRLNAVSDAVDAGDCNRALNASADLQQEIAGLPRSVDPQLRARLTSGAKTVSAKAQRACRAQTQTETVPTETVTTETTPTTQTQTQTTPTQTQTTQTQTQTTPSTPTATTPSVPTAPSGGGTGGGGDNGSGGGASPIP